ncbi:MAG TPA: PLP-dependent aminotransferase family protein [Blastocatellia bacterium]|jgi:2-aminoadipate transaminase|nr:PLP-dependent aminotransferase family protein [Blastocatellia bacterium]
MPKADIKYDELLSVVGRAMRPNAIRKLTQMLGRGDVISFAAGAPSAETFPVEEMAEIAARVIRERGRFALQYGPTRGQSALVEAVVAILRSRGVEKAVPSEVVMTSGSQQGLDLIARVLIDPGDIAFVELPSYIGGTIALHNSRAELVGVRQDEGGIVVGDLREKIERVRAAGRRAKCIYTIPNFQNPSGVTLAAERRNELIEIADEHDLLVIEDDAYFDLYFTEEASRLVPLAAFRPERVVYLGTFSKVLAPGVRTAYLRAPEEIALKVELAKEGADLSSSVLDQAIVVESLRSGLVERRLPELRKFYESRRRAMLDALDRFAPAGSRWTKPIGGFFILMELAKGIDAAKSLPDVIESGVAYVPGQPFFVDGSGENTLRLAYSKESPEKIAQGVELMCDVFHKATR